MKGNIMINTSRLLVSFAAVLFLTLCAQAADVNDANIMRMLDSRMKIDNPTNWFGLMQGSFTSSSFNPDGTGSTVTGRYVLAYSEKCCLINYRIGSGDRGLSMNYIVNPDSTVTTCKGVTVSDVHSLLFDPYMIVQRPYVMNRIKSGLSEFWFARMSWIEYNETKSTASVSVKYNDSKGVYVVDNSDEHRGRLLSYASYDGSLSAGYNPEPSQTIQYSYYTDGIYPDKVLETMYKWSLSENSQLTQRVARSASISVEFNERNLSFDESTCESSIWETTFPNLLAQ